MKIETTLDTSAIAYQLKNLSSELEEKAIRSGIARVANVGIKEMRALVPVKTGKLQKSINRKQLSKRARKRLNVSDEEKAVIVGPNMRLEGRYRGRIANVLEGGAKSHDIVPREDSRVHSFLKAQGVAGDKSQVLSDGTKVFGRKVKHPGVKPYRFIQRTDQKLAGQVTGLFYAGVRDYLQRKKLIDS